MSAANLAQELEAERERGGRRERLLEGENEVLKLIVERAPLTAILTELAHVAERQGSPGLLASILLMDDNGLHLRHGAAPSLPDAYNRAIDGIEIGPNVGSCGTAAYRREQVVVTDILTDPLWTDFRDLASSYGLRACWSTPVLSHRGQVLGTFALYYRTPSRPVPADRAVIQILTRTCALAIEHKRAERGLAESEEKFRCLTRCSPVGIFTTDGEGVFTYVNPRFQENSGYAFEKTIDFWLQSAADPEYAPTVLAAWQHSVSGQREFDREIPLIVDGHRRTARLRAAPMSSAAGTAMGYVGTLEDVTGNVALRLSQSQPK